MAENDPRIEVITGAGHASAFDDFNQECSLSSRALFEQGRTAALAECLELGAA